jgi:hypothetical protein
VLGEVGGDALGEIGETDPDRPGPAGELGVYVGRGDHVD